MGDDRGRMRRCEALKDPTSAYYKGVVSRLAALKREHDQRERSKGIEFTLPCSVDGETIRALEEAFGWKLRVFERRPTVTPLITAFEFCMNNHTRKIKAFDGEEVLTFDSDLTALATKMHTYVHGCRTYSSGPMAASYVRQEEDLRKALNGRNPAISVAARRLFDQLRAGNGPNVCKSAVTCRKVVDRICIDPTRTQVNSTMCAAMALQHQAPRLFGWFYFEASMLVSDAGVLSGVVKGSYYIDREADMLYIVPAGSTTATYSHRFSWMMSLLLESEVVRDHRRFFIERHDKMPGVVGYLMTRLDVDFERDTTLESRYYHPVGEKMVSIEMDVYLPKHLRRARDKEHVRIVASDELVSKCIARMLSKPDDKITLEEARLAVSDNSSQRMTRGAVVQAPDYMPYDMPELVARAVWRRSLHEKAKIVFEYAEARQRLKISYEHGSAWAAAIVTLASRVGLSFADAVMQLGTMTGAALAPVDDFVVSITPLPTAEILRNVIAKDIGPDTQGEILSCMPGGCRVGSEVSDSVGTRERIVNNAMAADVIANSYPDVEGFSDGSHAASSSSGSDAIVSASDSGQGSAVPAVGVVEHSEVVEERPAKRLLANDRRDLVAKTDALLDAHGRELAPRSKEVVRGRRPPECAPVARVEGVADIISDAWLQMYPSSAGVDYQIRAHMYSGADRSYNFNIPLLVTNASYDTMAGPQNIRRSSWLTGGGGARQKNQAEAMLSISKRIASAPRAQADRVLMDRLQVDFDKFASVCLRPGWKQTVKARVSQGAWQPRLSEIERNVAKLDTAKVTRMLQENFSTGRVNMQEWIAMVKPQAKAKASASVTVEHAATQTIVYQESKMTNSWFSALLSEFHDTLDETLRENVLINARRDPSDVERWFNSLSERRESVSEVHKYECDISQCDKSHNLYNLVLYFYVLEQFGAPKELVGLWEVIIGVKRITAPMVGIIAEVYEQLTSGAWLTISLNSIVVAIANVVALDLKPSEVISGGVTGDDSFWELTRSIDIGSAATDFREIHNLEAKIYKVKYLYFCSRYFVDVEGYYFWVRDPIKIAEAGGRAVNAVVSLDELYDSFRDDMRHYDKMEVLQALIPAVVDRSEVGCCPMALLRALSTAAADRQEFTSRYGVIETIVS